MSAATDSVPAQILSLVPSRPRLDRAAFVARLFDAGELELHEEGLLYLDARMGVWLPWEADARSTLDGRGGAA